MSPNNTFRPTLSLSIDQATAFLLGLCASC